MTSLLRDHLRRGAGLPAPNSRMGKRRRRATRSAGVSPETASYRAWKSRRAEGRQQPAGWRVGPSLSRPERTPARATSSSPRGLRGREVVLVSSGAVAAGRARICDRRAQGQPGLAPGARRARPDAR